MSDSLHAMAASPEAQAGSFVNSLVFKFFVAMLDKRFPGAGDFINQAATLLPLDKIWAALQAALIEYREGKDFMTILSDILSQWLVITPATPDSPIRMELKE